MLRVKLTKLKQVCASAFIPRILQEAKTVKKDNISKYSIEYLTKAKSSTDSGSKDKNLEERKRIIDKCFSEKTPLLEDIEQKTTKPLSRDKIKHHNVTTDERNKSFVSEILEKEDRVDAQRNTHIQSVAAQVEEAKQAHDINPMEDIHAEAVATKSKTVTQANSHMSEDTVQINTAPHLKSEKAEDTGTPKVSALLQNINVQTTTENVDIEEKLARNTVNIDKKPSPINVTSQVSEALDSAELEANVKEEKEKLVQQVVQIDKTPHVEIETDNVEEINSTSRVAEALEKADLSDDKTDIVQEKLTQQVVHIDKAPLVDIDVEKEKIEQNVHIDRTPYVDITPDQDVQLNTMKVTESLENSKVEATTIMEEKLSQHIVNFDKTPIINIAKEEVFTSDKKLSDLVQKSNVQATTAKIEEETLAQKIDKVEETPHVEANVDKIEGFNTSPRILGHETKHTLSASDSSIDTSDQPEQVNLDELAKKCLGKPVGEIDQILLKELKNISRANSTKFDLPKEDSPQKYFSQIFENKSKDNNNIVFDVTNANLKQVLHKGLDGLKHKEMGVDKFHPFHLDTVPIVTADTRNYDEDCKKNLNPDGFKNILLDIPAVLDPYDMQAIPFYQYVSKENIVLQELQVEPSPAKKIQESEKIEINAPMNEEVILRREKEESLENKEIKEFEEADNKDHRTAVANFKLVSDDKQLAKSTEMSALSESDVSKLLEYKHVLSAQQEALARMTPNVIQSQCPQKGADEKQASTSHGEIEVHPLETVTHTAFTSTTGTPTTPTDPFGNPLNIPADQPKMDTQSDTPPSTAISANQDPSEYFPTQHLSFSGGFSGIPQIEYEVTDSSVTYTGVFDTKAAGGDTTDDIANDNLISQSAFYYSIFPQLTDFEKYSTYRTPEKFNEKDRITQVFVRPQKEEYPEDFIQKETKADYLEKIQTESTRESVREEFIQAEPKVQDAQEDFIESEPKHQSFRENIVQPETTREDILDETVLPKLIEKVEISVTKDVEGIPISEETVPLSVLLRRVRERSRLELIRSIKAETEMKNPPCLPPLDKSKPKTTLQPKPCQPKPKEDKKPPPCKPPQKKDPCAKLVPFILGTMFSDVSIPPKVNYGRIYTYISLAKEVTFRKLKRLCQILGIINTNSIGDLACARHYEPWVPIPSWPLPKVEKKRELVCPKDGCKLPVQPVKSNTDKPCLGMPKKISPTKTLISPVVIDEL